MQTTIKAKGHQLYLLAYALMVDDISCSFIVLDPIKQMT